MSESASSPLTLSPDACVRALEARDPRFDGLFFVGITSTGIYCRPICPARVSHPEHRRFYASAAAAEHAGFRPCLRCRPELAPGRALTGAVSRLAGAAAQRIAAGALNGRSVAELARELDVGERHLRRVLERELGVSPVQLAQTHRLLLAKQLLADTQLSVTRVAYASGFGSLRRFNTVFRERYNLRPTDLRRRARAHHGDPSPGDHGALRSTLSYRPPLAWGTLISLLGREAIPGVEVVDGRRFGRTVRIGERTGVVFAEDAAPGPHVDLEVSASLVPVLVPLIARSRQLFDLDAEPSVIDASLERGGLHGLVARRRGLRLPGTLDGFEAALRILLNGRVRPGAASRRVTRRVFRTLGEELDTGHPGLDRVAPSAERVADAGAVTLRRLGVSSCRAEAIAALARAVADRALRLEAGGDVLATRRALRGIEGIEDRFAGAIALRALGWPDAFPARDRALLRAAAAPDAHTLRERAEAWRPWRAYAALHLWLHGEAKAP
jgi:AraC family transcriptional regulator, regulatory protein of adaptative response / DNA-3-methyladenine glycosylase II